jgi:hypothetical protein
MTEIVADVGSLEKTIKKSASPAEAERTAIRQLVVAARGRGEDLTGPDGLLKTLTKTVLETALEEEISEHLGYDKHVVEGRNGGNSRNGKRPTGLGDPAMGRWLPAGLTHPRVQPEVGHQLITGSEPGEVPDGGHQR